MKCLDKKLILASENGLRKKVEIPEWGGFVWVTAVAASDWMDLQDAAMKEKNGGGGLGTAAWMGRILARTIVDEHGQRLFTDEEAPELMTKPLPLINRLYRAADKLNDFIGRGLRDAEKNSDAGAGEGSPIPSLVN